MAGKDKKVVSIAAFKDGGISGIDAEAVDLNDLDLPEPQYGETEAGELTEEETSLFVELHRVSIEAERRTRELIGDLLSSAGKDVRESDLNKSLLETLRGGEHKPNFSDEEDEERYFMLMQRRSHLHALLHWQLGERLAAHSHRLGIRKPKPQGTALRVVKIAKRVE